MGLLDILNTDDGRFGLGLLAAAAPRTDGAGFGQRLNEAVGSVDQFKRQKLLARLQELQMQEAESSMADKAEQRKAQAAQLIEQQRLQGLFRNAGTVPANMQGTEAANAMLPAELRIGAQAQLQQPGKIDYNALRQQGMPAAMLEQLAKIQDLGTPEVARTIKGMQNGREVEQQYDKFGRPVGQGMEQFKAPIMMDRGGQIDAVSPYTAPGATFAKTMTFGDKNAMDQGNQNRPQWIESLGGFADPRNQVVMPARDMQGNPIEGAGKPMTDSQAKAALFGSRMQASDSVLGDLAKAGITKSLPGAGMGFGVGNVLNVVSPESQQRLNQAKLDFLSATLRRESGAVISDQEMKKGDQQYFPQIGDSPGVIEQKARNRAIAIRGVQAEVPAQHKKTIDSIIGAGGATGERTIVKTGVYGGRKVVQYSDGTTDYAN